MSKQIGEMQMLGEFMAGKLPAVTMEVEGNTAVLEAFWEFVLERQQSSRHSP